MWRVSVQVFRSHYERTAGPIANHNTVLCRLHERVFPPPRDQEKGTDTNKRGNRIAYESWKNPLGVPLICWNKTKRNETKRNEVPNTSRKVIYRFQLQSQVMKRWLWMMSKYLEGGGYDLFQGTMTAFIWREWGKPWTPLNQEASKLAEIWTWYLTNARLEHCCYINRTGHRAEKLYTLIPLWYVNFLFLSISLFPCLVSSLKTWALVT
jgi:hypothetical protein